MRLVNKSKTATVLECTPEELAMIGNALPSRSRMIRVVSGDEPAK